MEEVLSIKRINNPKGVNGIDLIEEISPSPGVYIVDDDLYLKPYNGTSLWLFGGISAYLGDVSSSKSQEGGERGDTISEDFLLKVLAVAKDPSLIKDLSRN